MSPRSIRRAAERRLAKQADKAARLPESKTPEPAARNQSTGPRTEAGKQRSSQNSFKHGLYSKALVLPHECAAEFDQLRAQLRAEHQPGTTTEEILVDELAQHFWRMRRFRALEATLWQPETLARSIDENLILLAARAAASAERGFHKSLQTLRQLQKDRQFIPASVAAAETPEFVPPTSPETLEQWLAEDDGLPEQVDGDVIWETGADLHQLFLCARERHRQFVPSKTVDASDRRTETAPARAL